MKTKVLIVDDENLAIEIIENYLSKFEDLEIVDRCNNALKAFEVLQKKRIDLMFLDIQMPEITGLEFLKSLTHPPKVIITTAYRQYALEGFELDVIDYLLKPISFERFLKAINKYYQQSTDTSLKLVPEEQNSGSEKDFIYVKENKKAVKIFLEDILFIEGMKDYVTIHSANKNVTAKLTMSKLEETLPENKFIRIHKSFIAGIDHIDAISAGSIEIGKYELTIGRSYKARVLKALNYNEGI